MKIAPFSEVACTILHDSYEPLDMNMVLAAVKHFAPEFGLGEMIGVLPGWNEKTAIAIISRDEYHRVRVEVAHMPEPLEMDGFREALSQPITSMMFPEAEEVIRRHQAYTIITVRKGESQLMMELLTGKEEAREMMETAPELFNYTTLEEAKQAKLLCNALSRIVMDQQPATLVHWMAHNRLLRPEQFLSLRGDDALLLLDINPHFFSSAGSLEKGAPLGCVLINSHNLVGKLVVFEEAPVPPDWMIMRLYDFLDYCISRGELIGDGETYGDEDNEWVFLIRHTPPEGPGHPGEVRLKLLYSKEHGIMLKDEMIAAGVLSGRS